MIRRIHSNRQGKVQRLRACAEAYHEGAIAMVDGKAELMRDDYCDGLGGTACPPAPRARSPLERSGAYDEQAVMENKQKKDAESGHDPALRLPGEPIAADQARGRPPHAGAQMRRAGEQVFANGPSRSLVPVNAPPFRRRKAVHRRRLHRLRLRRLPRAVHAGTHHPLWAAPSWTA